MPPPIARYDTVILGAGAAGMMCGAHAGARGGRVLVIDHARAPGEKIRISGGGRCNFTNLYSAPERFLSANPHFAKSALSRYSQHDFIALIDRHGIPWHEKTLGQLFCDRSAKDVIAMLRAEMAAVGAELVLQTGASEIAKTERGLRLAVEGPSGVATIACRHVVVACGGKSIPKMGATGFGYQIAAQFGHAVTETRAGLVPLTFGAARLEAFKALAGVAVDARVSCGKGRFDEAILFTHRGLSGPAILQISSYWREKMPVSLALMPQTDLFAALRAMRAGGGGRKSLATALAEFLPKRLAQHICDQKDDARNLADWSDNRLAERVRAATQWTLHPTGTEGYRTAEVTLGGVDTAGLNSRSMASKTVPELYFIGEVVDVTGWLGGYNFQWAWSSGWAAGTAIAEAG